MGYQQLAEDGFAVLGERLRIPGERAVVAEVLQKVLGAKVGAGINACCCWCRRHLQFKLDPYFCCSCSAMWRRKM